MSVARPSYVEGRPGALPIRAALPGHGSEGAALATYIFSLVADIAGNADCLHLVCSQLGFAGKDFVVCTKVLRIEELGFIQMVVVLAKKANDFLLNEVKSAVEVAEPPR